MKTEMRVKVS